MKEVLHTFTVIPEEPFLNQFPVDMLRYDHCYPASENDSAQISYSFERRSARVKNTKLEVKLCRYAHKNWVPTSGRWESFGWVIDLHGHAL
ncbi:MAG: hypothetical protein KAQ85_03115 [Thermodesulfovibrionia bacterium]|nr:hypothetical protein [Thermodesulfovibrionia bacterium]